MNITHPSDRKSMPGFRRTGFGADQTLAGGVARLYATLGDRYGLSGKKKPSPRRKMARRDIYQRKAYAVRRMILAVGRLSQVTSEAEKEKAIYWAKMWGAVSGIRQFKLGNGGSKRKSGDRS